ncbi:DUF7257 domain-containing protein [Tsukamurella tyrosinosolvens]|uniref:DUF7257 domain-containing protein n=1 Tax=Tsukamurella tyrosinosolvens TaxID=57704 RepID=UPI002DD441C1|nr:hypothetical protein [Tsukamurella tyrosinosolvens]MEC4616180.1 hypothetical protein [Tsukamurella tyrosinosolvens]
MIDELTLHMEKIPILGDLVKVLKALLDTDGDGHLEFDDLFRLLSGQGILSFLLGPDGLIGSWLLPRIGLGQLTNAPLNMAADGGFDYLPAADGSPAAPGRWFRDPAVGRTKPGAATFIGNGTGNDVTDVPFVVEPGKDLDVEAYVSQSAAAGSGALMRLVMRHYQGGLEVGSSVIASTSGGWAGWKRLGGSWTVPAGVTLAAPSVEVLSALTGGQVWADDVTCSKPGLIPQEWVSELQAMWAKVLAAFGITGLDGLPGLDLLANAWKNLVSLLSISNLTELLTNPGSFDGSAIIQRFIEFVLWPFNMLGKIVGGKLLDAQAPQSMLDIIDRIWNGWANLGDMLDFDRPGGDVLDSISGILGVGLKAQTGVASAEARLRALESAGNTITDDFQRSSSSSLGGAWSAFSSAGAGSGSVGTDGSGNAVWKPSGTGNRTLVYRNSSSVTTDSAVVRAVLASSPPQTWPDDAYSYVCLSVASSEVSYVRLRIGGADLVLQAVVTGTVTNLGTVSMACKAGDTIEIQRGLTGGTSLHSYSVRVNGVEVLAVTDGGATAKSGSGFRGLGIGMETSARATIWPPFLTQWQPAGFAIVSLSEVL